MFLDVYFRALNLSNDYFYRNSCVGLTIIVLLKSINKAKIINKTKIMKKLLLLSCAGAFLMSSCVSYKHSYRMSDVGDTSLSVAEAYVADLDVDFTKVVKASSLKHATAAQAKNEAYYNAITQNNIHVVVDPIYAVRTVRTLFGAKSSAEITGFTGMYKNARKKSDDAADAIEDESNLFNARFASIKKLSELTVLTEEEVNVYTVESGGCCGEGKKASPAGPMLLTTTTNKTGLIDSYNKIIASPPASNSSADVVVGQSVSATGEPKKTGIIGKIIGTVRNILSKLNPFN